MFGPGDGAIFLGDYTTHGGRVISGQQNYIVHGRPVAVVGDKVTCPKDGHGVCSIIEGHQTITVNGKPVAFHGCATSCGAKLISSMNSLHCIGSPSQSSVVVERNSNSFSARFQQPQQHYVRQFRVVDSETWKPLANRAYTGKVDGAPVSGITDADGVAIIRADRPNAAIELHVTFLAPKRPLEELREAAR